MENNKEIWKDIPEYDGIYQVSNFGNIKSFKYKTEKILKPISNGKYNEVFLCKNGIPKHFKVHTLVAITFLNHKPCGYEVVVNHIDHNIKNNNLNNLELISQRENTNKKHIKSTSNYTGCYYDKNRKMWQSKIYHNGNKIFLGYFKNEDEAGFAYQKALESILNGTEIIKKKKQL